MYAVIRKLKVKDPQGMTRKVNQGFLPIIAKKPGFIAYYVLESPGDTWTSISIFEERSQAEGSIQLAHDWAQDHLQQHIQNPPEITAGEVVIHQYSEVTEEIP